MGDDDREIDDDMGAGSMSLKIFAPKGVDNPKSTQLRGSQFPAGHQK